MACGGTVAKDKATAGATGTPKTVEVIDDVDHAGSDYDYPPLPDLRAKRTLLASGNAPFDLWVDDLALICSGKCP